MDHVSGERATPRGRSGFTIVELLVALAVVAVLIAILTPSLAGVREHARRIVCGSNQRQIGLALHLYADQWDSHLPSSVFLGNQSNSPVRGGDAYRPQDMVTVRVANADDKSRKTPPDAWDGLGLLFSGAYLPAPKVFYCPSHQGEHAFEQYADRWGGLNGEIVSNYHYRGMGPNSETRLHMIAPDAAIVSDSLRSLDEINHEGGFNVLHASLSVSWLPDEKGTIAAILARQGGSGGDDADPTIADEIWEQLDGDGALGGAGSTPDSSSNG